MEKKELINSSKEELCAIILKQRLQLRQRKLCIDEFKKALDIIRDWKLPETGKFWDKEKTSPMSYGACWGSNGERDYMKQVAQDAVFIYGGVE